MSASTLFELTSLFAGIGWIALLFLSPYWPGFDKLVIGVVIALLACVYTWLNFSHFSPDILKNFSSLDGVMKLFQNPALVVAAWVHIMGFDLLSAVWIKKNSQQLGIGHAWVLLPLIVSIPFGPLGYLLYLLIRWGKTKKYFAADF